jgi:hypothetical protein
MWDEVIPGRREPSARPLPAAVIEWLEREWHLAGLVCAVILLVLTPIWVALGAGALTLVYLQLPIYQLPGSASRRSTDESCGVCRS